jgi:hypothetical protein
MSRNQFLVGPFTPMTVLVRSKRDEKGSGRRRPSAFMTRPAPAQARGPVATGRSHRERETFQDNALYTCHCGFVFEAAVSTRVDCPHCGTGQAW